MDEFCQKHREWKQGFIGCSSCYRESDQRTNDRFARVAVKFQECICQSCRAWILAIIELDEGDIKELRDGKK